MFSFSCSIEEEDGAGVYIIGDGSYSPTVVRYTSQGESGALPDLRRGRAGPGCAGYNNNNNQFVLLVAGGFVGEGEYIGSTERFTLGLSASWEEAAALPHPLSDPRAVTFHNNILLFGKIGFRILTILKNFLTCQNAKEHLQKSMLSW